jgi:hypothetical protein
MKTVNSIVVKILSTHNNLEDAIAEAGGLNRDYNPAVFDREVEETKKSAAVQEFYVIEQCGRKEVVYQYQCDIRLLNSFRGCGGSMITNNTTVGALKNLSTGSIILKGMTYTSGDNLRKEIAKAQKTDDELFVLNF